MDLLACSECERRFYALGAGPSDSRRCPRCEASLVLTWPGVTSLPLDARSLDHGSEPARANVELVRKSGHAGEQGERVDREADWLFPRRAQTI